jgi:site-specific DNA-methyltransferase (adenine-specific)
MNYKKLKKAELIGLCSEKGFDTKGKTKENLIEFLEQTTNSIVENVVNPFTNKIVLGDCLVLMAQIPDNSIDLVCTDPPYFLDGLGNTWNKCDLDKKGASSRVGNLPKGMKFDRQQSKDFLTFYTKISKELYRVLKPGGAFLSFSSPRLYHSMAMGMEEGGFEIRDMIGWIYTHAQVKAFSQDHIIKNDKTRSEMQKVAMKEKCAGWKTAQLKPAIEPICFAVKPTEGRLIDTFDKYGTGLMNTIETKVGTNGDKFPANIVVSDDVGLGLDTVFVVPKPGRVEKGEFNSHLSVKPIELINHFIRLFSQKGATVLDPFMGSGTTGVSCVLTGRNYIGFDINAEYIKIAERRIVEAAK